ncbi:polysialyltransferase family glycosyltransferase [Enterococcus hulanensis]|uniref:polysialyltransferase family glycosyltransferase n=1 Tax=Enterococcus hulanensis TaxID=2559929 RepID=UPI00288FE6DC|nr:polysialyltransferase family glycosyltransferase [Enterococcus hulanensis]MDT2660857.1 polysialyltransferase family glycosyltransferase [Enterococcus hulanensis]
MIAFIAWTPLQIINIVNIKKNFFPEKASELFIYSEFQDAENIYENLNKENIFTNIYFIDFTQMGSKMTRVINLLLGVDKFKLINCHYSDFFISGNNYYAKIIYEHMKRDNSDIKLHYIEDGLAAYVSDKVFNNEGVTRKAYRKFKRNSLLNATFSDYYVYEPELSCFKRSLVKIPKIDQQDGFVELLNRIFSYTSKYELEDKLIYIDQPLKSDGYGVDEVEILNHLSKLTPEKKIVVKLHPRSKSKKYQGMYPLIQADVPFELCMLSENLNKSITISPLSTVSFSTSIMLEKKIPTMVLSEYLLTQPDKLNEKAHFVATQISNLWRTLNEEQSLQNLQIMNPRSSKEVKKIISEVLK